MFMLVCAHTCTDICAHPRDARARAGHRSAIVPPLSGGLDPTRAPAQLVVSVRRLDLTNNYALRMFSPMPFVQQHCVHNWKAIGCWKSAPVQFEDRTVESRQPRRARTCIWIPNSEWWQRWWCMWCRGDGCWVEGEFHEASR